MDGGSAPAHYVDLEAAERTAWDLMVRGVHSRRSAFHQATVATIGAQGAQARTVVLRGADRAARRVRFHTDRRSRKVAELSENPALAVHLYDHGAKVQVRLHGTAHLCVGDATAAAVWRGMREMSRACYRQRVPPGAAIGAPDEAAAAPLDDAAGFRNFVIVDVEVPTLEGL